MDFNDNNIIVNNKSDSRNATPINSTDSDANSTSANKLADAKNSTDASTYANNSTCSGLVTVSELFNMDYDNKLLPIILLIILH